MDPVCGGFSIGKPKNFEVQPSDALEERKRERMYIDRYVYT
jgi:hypothetical protein